MTDLVERLLAKAKKGGIIPIGDVTITEAAAEIVRLRAAVNRIAATGHSISEAVAVLTRADPYADNTSDGAAPLHQYFCNRCGTKRKGLLDDAVGIGGYSWACPECGSHDVSSRAS